jgi:APA family basic amino acid/polyamine antiporter
MCALALIWTLAAVNIRGLRDAGFLQIAMTALKIVPLVVIAGLGVAAGSWDNLPALAPQQNSPLPAIAACALLTLWAFTGFEAGVMPAGAVKDAERVIPRAIVIGMITVTLIYLTASFAVMLLVHPSELARSTAPFAEAARALGGWGPKLVAAGALLATAGALNGIIFVSGQAPMAAALDKLAPNVLGRTNAGGAPYVALLISVALGSALLLLNTSRGTIGAFQFLIMMSTGTILIPYLVSALAELRHSLDRAKSAALAAVIGGYFALFALIGSGWEVLAWGGVLLAIGLPLYILGRDLRR